MRKVLVISTLMLLAACNDSSSLEKVQSLPMSATDKATLREVLDRRQVCDKTTWTQTGSVQKGGEAQVEYRCTLSAVQTSAVFSSQWERYQLRLAAVALRDETDRPAVTRSKTVSLDQVTEVLIWSVPANGTPRATSHTVELTVRDGEDTRQITKTLGLADDDMVGVVMGDFNRTYQNVLVSAMSDLVR